MKKLAVMLAAGVLFTGPALAQSSGSTAGTESSGAAATQSGQSKASSDEKATTGMGDKGSRMSAPAETKKSIDDPTVTPASPRNGVHKDK